MKSLVRYPTARQCAARTPVVPTHTEGNKCLLIEVFLEHFKRCVEIVIAFDNRQVTMGKKVVNSLGFL